MKKLYILLLSVFLISANAFAYDEPQFIGSQKLNNTADAQREGYRAIKLVRFASRDSNAISLVSGDAVVYDTVSDDGLTVRATVTSADGAFAGIICTTIQSADGSSNIAFDDAGRRNWGYVIVHGKADARLTAGGSNGAVVGEPFATSRDQSRISGYETPSTDAASIARVQKASANSGGFFFNTPAASDTTTQVFVTAE